MESLTFTLIRTPPTQDLPATVLKLLPHGVVVIDRDAVARVTDLLKGRAESC